jgi:hypothetical protein
MFNGVAIPAFYISEAYVIKSSLKMRCAIDEKHTVVKYPIFWMVHEGTCE